MGVNLIFGAFSEPDVNELLISLFDNIHRRDRDRMILWTGLHLKMWTIVYSSSAPETRHDRCSDLRTRRTNIFGFYLQKNILALRGSVPR